MAVLPLVVLHRSVRWIIYVPLPEISVVLLRTVWVKVAADRQGIARQRTRLALVAMGKSRARKFATMAMPTAMCSPMPVEAIVSPLFVAMGFWMRAKNVMAVPGF